MMAQYLLAQAYGQGPYGSGLYGSGVIQIGPFILPATGAGLLAIISAAVIAVAIGLFWWARKRRKPVSPIQG